MEEDIKVEIGWVMMFEGKYWGIEREGDGYHMDIYNYIDDITKARISKGEEKPPNKRWFTYDGSSDVPKLAMGEWVKVKRVVKTTLEHL